MTVGFADTASSCGYLYSAIRGQGVATYSFDLPDSGIYFIWVRARGRGYGSDSFYVSLDGAAWEVFTIIPGDGGWVWKAIGPLSLRSGRHKLRFKCREENAQLDRVQVTRYSPHRPEIVPCVLTSTSTASPTASSTLTNTPTPMASETLTESPSPVHPSPPTRTETTTLPATGTPSPLAYLPLVLKGGAY